jgi:hypothetical protein
MYIQDKVHDIISKYKKAISELINPDHVENWKNLGFDGAPPGCESIEDFLENENCELDERDQISLQCYREFLEDIETLVEKDDEDL